MKLNQIPLIKIHRTAQINPVRWHPKPTNNNLTKKELTPLLALLNRGKRTTSFVSKNKYAALEIEDVFDPETTKNIPENTQISAKQE